MHRPPLRNQLKLVALGCLERVGLEWWQGHHEEGEALQQVEPLKKRQRKNVEVVEPAW